MILAILFAAAAPAATTRPRTAIDAERSFAADAQAKGQWTAFRAWATPDALMFVPEPIKAHALLNDKKDPASAVFWWPGASFVSCDGGTAVNTGRWVREWGKSVGYFTTVWVRQPDRTWKWTFDAGDTLKQARAQGGDIKARVATCPKLPVPPPPQLEMPAEIKYATGSSKDGTLSWFWSIEPNGARIFNARLWNGREHEVVVDDRVVAPPK